MQERSDEEDAKIVTQEWNLREFDNVDEWFEIQPDLIRNFANRRQLSNSQVVEEFWKYLELADSRIKNIPKQMRRDVLALISKAQEYSKGISYYSAARFSNPARCPDWLELDTTDAIYRRNRNDQQHFQFISDLYQAWKSKTVQYETFLGFIGKEGVGLIDGINFIETEAATVETRVRKAGKVETESTKKLIVFPNFRIDGIDLFPSQLSDGTFKVVALAFYLHVDAASLLLIEEPELCIHHGLLSSLIELIKIRSETKQIIVSTHSEAVLDLIDPEKVFVVKKDKVKGTKIKPLPEHMSRRSFAALKSYLATEGSLGEFWRVGEIE
jgi:ABC-type transporter Mla maintaining outer membrane lipid asymmetry ATPase subunit MlaF